MTSLSKTAISAAFGPRQVQSPGFPNHSWLSHSRRRGTLIVLIFGFESPSSLSLFCQSCRQTEAIEAVVGRSLGHQAAGTPPALSQTRRSPGRFAHDAIDGTTIAVEPAGDHRNATSFLHRPVFGCGSFHMRDPCFGGQLRRCINSVDCAQQLKDYLSG